MIIIGELLNSSRDIIKEKIKEQDQQYIQKVAQKQVDNGADYIDVNAGAFARQETDYLVWLIETVQEVVAKPLAIDTANPYALKQALKVHQGTPLVNSITAEKKRYKKMLPLIKKHDAQVIALCMGEEGFSDKAEPRIKTAERLLDMLMEAEISHKNIFLDPLVRPISVNGEFGVQVLTTIKQIRDKYSQINITCGLSNVSYGMPNRKLLNQAFLVMGMEKGLNSAIVDPLDSYLMSLIKAAEVLLNRDQFARNYIEAAKTGKLD